MKLLLACFHVGFLLLIFSNLVAEEQEQIFSLTEFEKARVYKKTLSIPDAYELEVQVTGHTEVGKDKVFLYDETNQPLVNAPLSGQIDWHEVIVSSTVRVEVKTGTRVTDGELTVKIAKKDSNQVYREIKTKLVTSANKLLEINAVEIKTALEQHFQETAALRDKINETQEVKKFVPEAINNLMSLAKIYHSLIAKHAALTRAHQQELEEIRLLKQRTQGYQNKARENVKLAASTPEAKNAADLSTMYAAEQALWEKLFAQQLELETKLIAFSKKISTLLDILTERAKIYQKSADLALMSEAVWGVLKEFTTEVELQQLSSEIGNEDDAIRALLTQFQ